MTRSTVARKGLSRNNWHQYQYNGSAWLPGVTTVLRVQDAISGSDGLVRWAARLAAKAAFETATRPDMPEFDLALEAALAAVDEPRNKGTRVHAAIDAAARDEAHLPTPADGSMYYHWSRFLMREKPEIHTTEQMVVNVNGGYGGTFDMDATIRGKRSLIDLKTGSVKDTHVLQLAALSAGQWMGAPDDPTSDKWHCDEPVPMPEFEAFYVLALHDDGYELIPLSVGPAEVKHFQFLADTYHALKAWEKREKPSLELVA